MAYDPEARSQSNSAMIIGVVALILIVGGALAYLSSSKTTPDTVAITPAPADRTVVVNQPAPNPAAPVVIEKTSPVIVTPPVTKTIESHTTVTRDRAVAPPAASPNTKTETNVTVNMPKADSPTEPNKTTLQAQSGTNASEPEPTVVKP